jgi:hypothetical protein
MKNQEAQGERQTQAVSQTHPAQQSKQAYSKPELKKYGTLEKLTLASFTGSTGRGKTIF